MAAGLGSRFGGLSDHADWLLSISQPAEPLTGH